MSGCTGHCCKRFNLPFSPKDLRKRGKTAQRWLAWEKSATDAEKAKHADALDGAHEIAQIAGMAVYLGRQRPGKMFDPPNKDRSKKHFYTCSNLQPDGRCGVYATRPKMCSDYPYGAQCRYAKCTWQEVRAMPPLPQEAYSKEGRT